MLIGLPCSGKSSWAKKVIKQDFTKNYTLLSHDAIMTQMHIGRKDQRVTIPKSTLDLIESVYLTLLSLAGTRERNYVVDNYNVTPIQRKIVLKNFPGFRTKALVFLPRLTEIKKRYDALKDENKISWDSLLQMLRVISIPRKVGTTFTDIEYVGTSQFEDIVNEYRGAAPAPEVKSSNQPSLSHSDEISYGNHFYLRTNVPEKVRELSYSDNEIRRKNEPFYPSSHPYHHTSHSLPMNGTFHSSKESADFYPKRSNSANASQVQHSHEVGSHLKYKANHSLANVTENSRTIRI
jgi:predicted kinase